MDLYPKILENESLTLNSCEINEMNELFNLLESDKTITSLNIGGVLEDQIQLKKIMKSLKSSPNIISLNLMKNDIGDKGKSIG